MKKTFWIDLFSGSGGTSEGIKHADGAEVVACVNHDAVAIADHLANHPNCTHFTEDIRDKKVPVALAKIVAALRQKYPGCRINLWASLECTNFSQAKGGLPKDADSRTLPEEMYMYIEAIQPDAFYVENVREFMKWGPIKDGFAVKALMGTTYEKWVAQIKSYGYEFDCRLLNAADYGAYTSRTRYFAQFVRPGIRISWPTSTHAKKPTGALKPWKPVKDVLDLQDYGQSIFTRKKPLVEPSLKRIYEGLVKFCGADFLYKYYSTGSNLQSMNDPAATLGTKDTFAAVFIANYYTGEQQITSAEAPCPTITTVPHQALVTAQYVMDPQFNNVGTSIENPAPTILASRHHHKLVSAQFLLNPKYSSKGSSINDPCFTLIARMDKAPPQLISTSLGHVEILSTDSPMTIKIKEFMRDHGISDIFVRMLKIPELKRIMGFPNSYVLTGTQTQQKKHIGNAVERRQATALAQANVEANALRD